jgi:autotransporter-associated beta strand protein
MAIISWNDPVSGDWSVGTDWTTGAVPLPGDTVFITVLGAPYTVTVSGADFANSLIVNAGQAVLRENSGSLTIGSGLHVMSGLVSLNKANTMGSVTLAGGTLAVGNAGALGTSTVTQSGGELLGTANETLTNIFAWSGSSTIAAAHGTTLIQKGADAIAAGSTLNFGAPGQDGTVVWGVTFGSISAPFPAINVEAGTLKGGSIAFGAIIDDSPIMVAAGATLDLAGDNSLFANLTGGGSVTNSGAAATLKLVTANFSGTISGALNLEAQGTVTLTGNNTYTGTTTIDSGAIVEVGVGGATGSIGGGAIVDNGALFIFRSNAITLTNAISGGGIVRQIGSSVTSINTANTYTGGTSMSNGTLAIGNGGALGTGTLTQGGGELLATANETLTNALLLSVTPTISAAHGKTLTEKASNYHIGLGSTLNFGAPGHDGTVVWAAPPGPVILPFPAINVEAGTLKGANGDLRFLLNGAPVMVAAGATLDLAGNGTEFANLTGSGSVIDSGAATTLTLNAGNFSGAISGPLSLTFNGAATLTGLEDNTGGATLGAIVTNDGAYDLVANANITGGGAGTAFLNNHIFEKTGGGVSDVSTDFVNSGTLNVLSGSVRFTDGFSNDA